MQIPRSACRSTPIVIVSRDRLSPLTELVEWLEANGYENLVIVDNCSTFEPLLTYLDRSPHHVVRLPENMGPVRSVWATGVLESVAGGRSFVVTDNDVVPDPGCPGDAVEFFAWVLNRYPSYAKAGFGLRIDDLPTTYEHAAQVKGWEQPFWSRRIRGNLYHAKIDTTFALYRPDSKFVLGPAVRTGAPYLARHVPWYANSAELSEEERYYRANARPDVNTWDRGERIPVATPRASRWTRTRTAVTWRAHCAARMARDRSAPRSFTPERTV